MCSVLEVGKLEAKAADAECWCVDKDDPGLM